MPNWCMNSVTLRHEDPNVIREMVKKLEVMEEHYLFRTLDPTWEYREAHEVDWSVDSDYSQIDLNFDSAWSPPTELYETLEDQGWRVWATYYEPGLAFAGIYEDGDNNQYDDIFEITEEDIDSDEMLKEIVEQWNILDEIEAMRGWDDDEDE